MCQSKKQLQLVYNKFFMNYFMKLRKGTDITDLLLEIKRTYYYKLLESRILAIFEKKPTIQRLFMNLERTGYNKSDPIIPEINKITQKVIENAGVLQEISEESLRNILKIIQTVGKEFRGSSNTIELISLDYNNNSIQLIYSFNSTIVTETIPGDFSKLFNRIQNKMSNSEKLMRVTIVLLRYMTVVGDSIGLQMALPAKCFDVLQKNLEIYTECFASPLNVNENTKYFCSRFPDTDKYFGSIGKFSEITLDPSISYELNPPFTEELINETLTKVLNSKSTCVVILPCWDDMELVQKASKIADYTYYLPAKIPRKLLIKAETITGPFYYENGLAIVSNFRTMRMNKDSIVFVFLKNKQSKIKWNHCKNDFFNNFRISSANH